MFEKRCLLFVAIGLGCLAANLIANVALERDRLLRGDARRFYLYLPSIVIDHDLQLANDQFALDTMEGLPVDEVAPASGYFPNAATIGTAIAWAPFFLFHLLSQAVWRLASGGTPIWDGYTPWMQASAIVAGVFYAVCAALLTARLLDRWYRREVSTAATLLVWLATPAVYYTLVSPAYSHTVGWFSAALALGLWVRARTATLVAPGPWMTAGVAFGFAAMVRPQDAILIGLPLMDIAWPWSSNAVPARIRTGAALAAGAAIGFLPQMLTWRVLYGGLLANPLGEPAQWLNPRLLESFLGLGVYGLFSWAPVTLVAVIGLVYFARREAALGAAMLGAVLLAGYFQAAVPVLIETGTSFGPRRFVSYTPLFAIGVAQVWTLLASKRLWVPVVGAGLLTAWNLVLVVAYQWLVRSSGIYATLRQLLGWLLRGHA